MLNALADTRDDLRGPLRRPDDYVLSRDHAAFTHRSRSIDRMQRNQVHSALTRAGDKIARALGCAFSDICASAPDLTARAARLLLVMRLLMRRRALTGTRLVLCRRTGNQSEQQQGDHSESGFHKHTDRK